MKEIWKPIYEGRYEVSSHGRVRSLSREIIPQGASKRGYRKLVGRVLIPQKHTQGYLFVVTYPTPGERKARLVHQLVAEAFLVKPTIMGRLEVRHLDGVKTNNRLGNIAWGSTRDNKEDMRRHGTLPFGSKCSFSKLNEMDVRDIKRRVRNGEVQMRIAEEYGVHFATISAIHKGKNWKHVEG